MENKSSKVLLTKNNQSIKEITKQDLLDLNNHLEQLASWGESLWLLKDFFNDQGVPLNKKKIMREFHAQSKIFNAFYESFISSMNTLETKIEKLMEKEKVKGERLD